jgi:membrane-associated phospholipid phosphatase
MNTASSRLRSTGRTSSDMSAIWSGALVVVYLAATGLLLLVGRSRVTAAGIALHFAVLTALAVATWHPLVPRWLRLWAPLMALLFLYTEMPMLIGAGGHTRVFDRVVMGWEARIFGSQPAVELAARWPSFALSELLHAAYVSYYALIVVVPVLLHFSGRLDDLAEATFVLMLTFIVCFAAYLFFPVEGPRYWFHGFPSDAVGPMRRAALALLESRSSAGTAFPSSHVAVAVTQTILAFRYFGRSGWAYTAVTAALALGAVYGGFHYAIDVAAGVAVGVLTTTLGWRLAGRLRAASAQAKASAPT